MNSKQLLEHLQNGAKLITFRRYSIVSGKSKRVNTLTLLSGQVLDVQTSAIKGLIKTGEIHSIYMQGGNYSYYLEGQNWYDVLPLR